MPEMFRATEIIYNRPELRASIALVTDGRFSGAIRGPAIGNVTPEAATGGPLAFVEDDDLMSIDIPGQSLEIVGFDSKHQGLEAVERKLRECEAARKGFDKKPEGVLGLFPKWPATRNMVRPCWENLMNKGMDSYLIQKIN